MNMLVVAKNKMLHIKQDENQLDISINTSKGRCRKNMD